jgi:hypothetical protein
MVESGSISVAGHGTRAGNRAQIVLDIDIPENCHIEAHEPAEPFLIPTVIEVHDLHEVEIAYPRPHRKEIIPGAELLVYDTRIRQPDPGRDSWPAHEPSSHDRGPHPLPAVRRRGVSSAPHGHLERTAAVVPALASSRQFQELSVYGRASDAVHRESL